MDNYGVRIKHFGLGLVAGLIAIFSVSSCSTINSGLGGTLDLDTDFLLEFKVDADINPDDNNVPSPLFIRMYELKSDKAFSKADFLDLYEKDQEMLGGELLEKHELKRLTPGEDDHNKFVLAKETRYIGLYAEFLQYKDAAYKLIVPVIQKNIVRTRTVVSVSGNSIEIYQPPRRTNSADFYYE